jgi:glycosyltransferase involved in cell wall biosynthesis
MKILFFVDQLGDGGKERQLVELIRGLQRYPNIKSELVLTEKKLHYTEILDTQIKIHYILRGKIKKNPLLFYLFYKIARKFRPDFIHVWDNMVAVYAIPAKILLRIPLINNEIRSAPDKVNEEVERFKYTRPFSDKIVANSFAGLESYKQSIDKGMVIYNGFDFKRIENLQSKSSIREKFNIRAKFVVGMAATFSEYKDYPTYVQAASIVLNRNYDVCFLCFGGGNDSRERQMVSPNHKNNILFLGLQADVESIINVCDIGVLSTFTEGISNSIIEYMALLKPVVATQGGGTKELLLDGETGFLVPKKSPEIMAEKIIYLLENPEVGLKMGKVGYKRIVENFSIDKMVADYYKLFDEMYKKRKNSNPFKKTVKGKD